MTLEKLEKKFGLPPLKESLDLLTGKKGKSLINLLNRLDELSKDAEGMKQVVELLKLVKEIDEKGTLERLNTLLINLKPLTQGQTAKALVEKLDKMEKLIELLVKE